MNSLIENDKGRFSELENFEPDSDVLEALRDIYLYAGLSLQHAASSARADYECNFLPSQEG